ncbi:MAG TPA: response regulator [Bacteroidia bacterium]|nr:response regulator [Bacteroidia bacterium]
MKLDYRILWLDDKINDFIDDEHVDDIKKHLKDEEFNPIIDVTDKQDEFYNYLENNDYDLILTDFHLNEKAINKGINGGEIVETVRNSKNIFTEILFYTAKATLEGSFKWDRISFLETENLPDDHHDEVIKKVKKLIDLTINKFHDIVVMRGMIMNETSDLDNQKVELIKKFINDNNPGTVNGLKLDILREIDKHFSSKLRKVNGEWKTKPGGFINLMKDDFVFSASYKIKTLGWILNKLFENDFSNEYKEEIINVRNLFAHVTLEEEKDEHGKVIRRYFKRGDMTFDPNKCKEIRRNINKHKENLDKLKIKLNE